MAGSANGILGQIFAPAQPLPGPLGGLLPPQIGLLPPPQISSPDPGLPRPKPPPRKQRQGYFVDRLPKVIRKQLGGKSTLADQCMDYWITQPRNLNPEDGLTGKVCRCIMEAQKVKDWDKTRKFKSGVPDFAQAERNVEGLIDVVSFQINKLPVGALSTAFPPQPIPARPPGVQSLPSFEHNDHAWAAELEQWRVGNVEDGSAILDLNELSYFLGNYNWCWLYTGEARRFNDPNPNQSLDPNIFNPNLVKVTVNQVGLYAVDAYDFVNRTRLEKQLPGGQPLGYWNVDDGSEEVKTILLSAPLSGVLVPDPEATLKNFLLCADPGYYPPMGWCYVTNDVFNKYRDTVKDRGRDFFIYSTVDYLPHSFTFFYNQATKKRVTFNSPPF